MAITNVPPAWILEIPIDILWVEEILHQFIGGLSMFIPLFLGFLSSTECQITTWEP